MNNSSGIEHIKSQLFSEGKLFSFEGRANRLQFFIITLFTLPIFIFVLIFGAEVLLEILPEYSDFNLEKVLILFSILIMLGSISGYIFCSAARRRLRSLNIPSNPYINYLVFLNIFALILIISFIFFTTARLDRIIHEGAEDILEYFLGFVLFSIMIIDIIVLLIMFFIKGVSNANQK